VQQGDWLPYLWSIRMGLQLSEETKQQNLIITPRDVPEPDLSPAEEKTIRETLFKKLWAEVERIEGHAQHYFNGIS